MSYVMVDTTWIFFLKTHKVHTNEGQNNFFKNMFIRHNVFWKKTNPFQKSITINWLKF